MLLFGDQDIYFNGVKTLRFVCCGVVYSTHDPNTYQYIDTFLMKKPTMEFVGDVRVSKEIVYTLCCVKNGCLKLEIHRYCKENGEFKLFMTRSLKGLKAINFLEKTKDMRIKLPQCSPLKPVYGSKKVPWVYGKAISDDIQVARYFDESGDRHVFKDKKWEKEVFKFDINTHTI